MQKSSKPYCEVRYLYYKILKNILDENLGG